MGTHNPEASTLPTLPRFLPGINTRGGCHILSVASRSPNEDQSEPVGEFLGRAFCGTRNDGSYWTNWSEYATVDDLCKRCLKAWVAACRRETDPGALRELQALLGGEA